MGAIETSTVTSWGLSRQSGHLRVALVSLAPVPSEFALPASGGNRGSDVPR